MIKKFRICYKSSDSHKNIFYFGDSSQFMIGLDGTVYENYGRSNKPMWESVFDAEVVLQQWTGLLDKNGREIYEGDVIKIGDRAKEVEFKMGMFYIDEDYGDFVPVSEVDNIIEVIGNIFENPLDKLQNNN